MLHLFQSTKSSVTNAFLEPDALLDSTHEIGLTLGLAVELVDATRDYLPAGLPFVTVLSTVRRLLSDGAEALDKLPGYDPIFVPQIASAIETALGLVRHVDKALPVDVDSHTLAQLDGLQALIRLCLRSCRSLA